MSFPLRSQEEGELASKASVLGTPGNSISEGKLPQQGTRVSKIRLGWRDCE